MSQYRKSSLISNEMIYKMCDILIRRTKSKLEKIKKPIVTYKELFAMLWRDGFLYKELYKDKNIVRLFAWEEFSEIQRHVNLELWIQMPRLGIFNKIIFIID